MSFFREWIKVNQVMTRIISIGGNLSSNPDRVYIVFPGNPGISSFYEDFMESLYCRTGKKSPVWVIGHAGHDVVGQESHIPIRKSNCDLFSLEGQVRHKVDFIQKCVPKSSQVVLIGHSIGSKIILEVMKHFENDPERQNLISAGYLLFPTIERMYQSPNGFICWLQTAYFAQVLIGLAWLFQTFLPKSILFKLITYAMTVGAKKPSESIVRSVDELINPLTCGNVLYMAYTELIQVVELDRDTVERFSPKLRFYFGANDRWCPVKYYSDMVDLVPSVRAQVCEKNVPHAFVLGHSDEIAEEVSKWIEDDKL